MKEKMKRTIIESQLDYIIENKIRDFFSKKTNDTAPSKPMKKGGLSLAHSDNTNKYRMHFHICTGPGAYCGNCDVEVLFIPKANMSRVTFYSQGQQIIKTLKGVTDEKGVDKERIVKTATVWINKIMNKPENGDSYYLKHVPNSNEAPVRDSYDTKELDESKKIKKERR